MKCEYCKYAPPVGPEGEQDECYHFEKQGTIWKDGQYGCTCHPKTLEKESQLYAEHLGWMGTCMGLEMDFSNHGWDIEKTVEACKHMIGFHERKVYHRHGKAFYKAYRNYWCGTPREDFELMCKSAFELMEYRDSKEYRYYYLTDRGLKWLGGRLRVNIKEED